MRERLYFDQGTPTAGRLFMDVCTCGGELQVRLNGFVKTTNHGNTHRQVRAPLQPHDLERLRDFFEECIEMMKAEAA